MGEAAPGQAKAIGRRSSVPCASGRIHTIGMDCATSHGSISSTAAHATVLAVGKGAGGAASQLALQPAVAGSTKVKLGQSLLAVGWRAQAAESASASRGEERRVLKASVTSYAPNSPAMRSIVP